MIRHQIGRDCNIRRPPADKWGTVTSKILKHERFKLDKKDLIAIIAHRAGFTQSDTKILLDTMVEIFQEVLVNGEEVKYVGFMKAYVTDMASYEGYDPFSDKRIHIPARKRVVFRTSRVIDQAVNKAFESKEKTDE